jgi:hypothetical protein
MSKLRNGAFFTIAVYEFGQVMNSDHTELRQVAKRMDLRK